MNRLYTRAMSLVVSSLCVFSASAQYQSAGTINYVYSEQIDRSSNVGSLGENLFGDSTSYENGSTTFSVTDVAAATNVKIPVQLGRTLAVRPSSTGWKGNPFPSAPEIFGVGWGADIPYIQHDGLVQDGWLANGSRCSAGSFSVNAVNVSSVVVFAHNFFFGNDINIPGYGTERLLARLPGDIAPTGGGVYVGTTRSQWKISCLPSIKNGPGEGFVVTLPDGAKYYFDWMAMDDTGYIDTLRGALYLRRFRLYATKAIDRFGGEVSYAYDATYPHRITKITSSDGVVISASYDASTGKVASVTMGTRTWTYEQNNGYLATVTLPDDSKWAYSSFPHAVSGQTGLQFCEFTAGTRSSNQIPDPKDVHSFRITHPSGAVGDFSFRAIMFGNNRTPGQCQVGDYIPKAYIGNALFSKSISGPGITTKSWDISYYPSWSYSSECTGCPTTATTVVTESTGNTTTYNFGNDYATNAGQLLSKTVSGGGVSSVENYAYLSSAAGQPFPDAIGEDKYQIVSNPLRLKNRPLKVTTISIPQQGVTFTTVTNTWDAFARPLSVTRSSTIPGVPARTDVTAYYDDLALWVTGQVASVTNVDLVPNKVLNRTTFNAKAQPEQIFGPSNVGSASPQVPEQTIQYNSNGTIKSIADGLGNATQYSSWMRGVPQSIQLPATPEKPGGAFITSSVATDGTITWLQGEAGDKTCYTYDNMGRTESVTYTSETATTPVCDVTAWNPTTQSFIQSTVGAYGLPANHWQQTVATGDARTVVYFDGLWRPVVERTYSVKAGDATATFVVKRYDGEGRLVFQSYPMESLSDYRSTLLKGVHTTYDALGRPLTVTQDSELGPLVTTTQYGTGFTTKVTNPNNKSTTTGFFAQGAPGTDKPAWIDQPEGVRTVIDRDVLGNPTAVSRSGPGG